MGWTVCHGLVGCVLEDESRACLRDEYDLIARFCLYSLFDRPRLFLALLNEEELEQYEILLEEQAFPFEEKAIELYEVNVPRAANGLYDQAVKDSYRRLAELMPGTYAKSERSENYALLSD